MMRGSDDYDVELMVSFGRTHIASAGHIAVCIREGDAERVYSANFYADREHEDGKHYTDDLVMSISRDEYLWGTETTSPGSCFGTDYGECYARSVLGIRFCGIRADAKAAMRNWVEDTNTRYAEGDLLYSYTGFNCAYVAGAMMQAAGATIELSESTGALGANVPMAVVMDSVKFAGESSIGVHSCLYRRYGHSTYVPHDEDTQFKDFLNRFPAFRTTDYAADTDNYEAWCNLHAMYLFHECRRWIVQVDDETLTLCVLEEEPKSLQEADTIARASASAASKNVISRVVRMSGFKVTDEVDLKHLYWQ
eukprot:TRINITY_DN15910_c0_g2_i1.p1 TRINITY_DN15910_c0_g2~~TRINITY_DN15910_c0_g2_i1.p1  ORF type:complete len:308 (-),score=55.30 TRINITY_DN15910_c0_g2_i1:275-1198(-)